jgi:hypothetical protein
MKPHWRTILIAICLVATLGAAPAQADRYRGHGASHNHGHHYGYRGSYGWSYAPLYRAAPAPACRQTREYTTQITIGDQVLPAYGTACLQADGSWKIISGPILADE